MAKNNKVISFADTQKRNQPEYKLKYQIAIHISRNMDTYHINWSSPDASLTQKEIDNILQSVFQDLIKKLGQIDIKKSDNYNVSFTLLYYENNSSRRQFKHICIPQTIKEEKLAEYLFIAISLYELKKTGAL